MRMRHIVICGLPSSTVFFPHCLINGTIIEKTPWTSSMGFDILKNFCLKHFSFYEEFRKIWSNMYISPHVKYPLFLSDFNP